MAVLTVLVTLAAMPRDAALLRVLKWVGRTALAYVRSARNSYRYWKRERARRHTEAKLDKVALLVSRKNDCRAINPWYWPPQTMNLWRDAFDQMIQHRVNWEISSSKYGARVWFRENSLHVEWDDFGVSGKRDIRYGPSGVSGVPDNKYWDLDWLKEHHGGPFNKAFSTSP